MDNVLEAYFADLRGHQFISLTTFRRTGVAVSTPVWFAEADGRLYVTTDPKAGKVKRIRHTARVIVAPCRFNGQTLGPALEARARILTAQECAAAEAALKAKYGLQWTLLTLPDRLRGRAGERAFLEITPPPPGGE